jgi:hypothetical protein
MVSMESSNGEEEENHSHFSNDPRWMVIGDGKSKKKKKNKENLRLKKVAGKSERKEIGSIYSI